MLNQPIRELYQRVTEHARSCADAGDHTVAAGILTESGRIVLGLNAYHFLGGPCGEVSALANHAATCPEDPIRVVAAVYGPSHQLVPPCGKCRQVFFDIDPDTHFLLRSDNGLITRSAAALLPFAFAPADLERPQRIFMWEVYEAALHDGSKRQTIRLDDPFVRGDCEVIIDREDGSRATLPGRVTRVSTVAVSELTEEHARRDGFASRAELLAALHRHYPGVTAATAIDVVTFELS